MTATADPLVPILHSNALKIAVVFDFIPMHYPTVYLRHFAARSEYAAALDALRLYDEFVCISALARTELLAFLGGPTEGPAAVNAAVAWPRDVLPAGMATPPAHGQGPIVVMTGDEPRKNTFGALAAIGAATAGTDQPRDVVVLGMAGQDDRVHHWSIAAAMRPGEARTVSRLSDRGDARTAGGLEPRRGGLVRRGPLPSCHRGAARGRSRGGGRHPRAPGAHRRWVVPCRSEEPGQPGPGDPQACGPRRHAGAAAAEPEPASARVPRGRRRQAGRGGHPRERRRPSRVVGERGRSQSTDRHRHAVGTAAHGCRRLLHHHDHRACPAVRRDRLRLRRC